MKNISHGFRVTPETLIKIRLLSAALGKSQLSLIETMVDRFWEENLKKVAEVVSMKKIKKETRRLLHTMSTQ